MPFLVPGALFGLAAALVPPLLHLFQRREPPVREFPAVRYLLDSEREALRSARLTHLVLLLLRVLAVVLIVLAAARPVVPGRSAAVHEPTAVVLIVDHSLSSGAVPGGARVLDDLAARARETLRAAGAADALWLLGADGIARRGTAPELAARVAALEPDPRRLDLAAAVRAAAGVLRASGYTRTEIHLLSDLQATAIGAAPEPVEVPLVVYRPAGAPPPNRAVTAARPEPPLWVGGAGSVTAEIGGAPPGTSRPAAALTLDARAGGRALVGAGGVVSLAAPRAAQGWHTGSVALDPDELRADDVRWFGVRVVAPAAVAVPPPEAGTFVADAVAVLAAAGRLRMDAAGVRIGAPRGGGPALALPPADPARLGAVNRDLAGAGVRWRFGERVAREDTVAAPDWPALAGVQVTVRRRLVADGDTGEVLARVGGEPWLVRDGGVLVLGSRPVPEESALPLAPGFVMFLDAALNRLVRGESGVVTAVPGQPVAIPAGVDRIAAGDATWPAAGGTVTEAPPLLGVAALRSGADTVGMLVLGADPRESNLARAEPGAVRMLASRVEVTDDAAAYAAARFRGAGRTEVTGLLLAAALVVLVAESLLAAGGLRRNA